MISLFSNRLFNYVVSGKILFFVNYANPILLFFVLCNDILKES